jgi:hypothetical protein
MATDGIFATPDSALLVSITVLDDQIKRGETSSVAIRFAAAVQKLTVSDFVVQGGKLASLSSSDGGVNWTAIFTPTSNIEDTSNVVSLLERSVVAAGNKTNEAGTSNNYQVDTKAPLVTFKIYDSALKLGDSSPVSIKFSEPVTGLELSDLTVENGRLTDLVKVDSTTWTAVLWANDNVTDLSNVITLAAEAVTDLAGNANLLKNSTAFKIDSTRPDATLELTDKVLHKGDTTELTVTFSEAVKGLDLSDFVVASGALSNLRTVDNVVWTADFTPTDNLTDTTNSIQLRTGAVIDSFSNKNLVAKTAGTYKVDTLAPVATITLASDTLVKDGYTTVTISFTESVTGLDISDFEVENGELSALVRVPDTNTWTATLTVTSSNVTSLSNLIKLKADAVVDAFGNTNAQAQTSFAVDTVSPTVVITDDEGATGNIAGGSITYTFTFSEAVTGFVADDVTVNNGTKGAFTAVSPTVYTLVVTPDANYEGNVTVDVAAGVAIDAETNTNAAAGQSVQAVDTKAPTVVITDDEGATGNIAGGSITYTFTFSEAVTGFVADDVTVNNGTKGAFTAVSPTVYTLVVTPDANYEGNVTVDVAANKAVDAQSNANTAASQSVQVVDTKVPTVSITDDEGATGNIAGGSITYTFTFSEAVTGFVADDVTVNNGTKGAFTAVSSTVYTLVVTPTEGFEGNVTVDVAASKAVDAQSNANTAASQSVQAVDTKAPTVNIALADAALIAGASTSVTFTFSEAVSGFTNADLSISAGTLSPVGTSDGGVTWTATFTADANINSATNLITLAASGVADANGNANAATSSANYTIESDQSVTWTNFLAGNVTMHSGSEVNKLTITAVPNGADLNDNDTAFANISNVELMEYQAATGAIDLTLSQNSENAGVREVTVSGAYGSSIISLEGYATGVKLTTGSGHDTVYGSDYADTLLTGLGDDSIDAGGGNANDSIDAGEGNNTIKAGDGDDIVLAGSGNDTIDAGAGDDSINAGAGIDSIDAGLGNDTIYGAQNNDNIQGNAGDDTLVISTTYAPVDDNNALEGVEIITVAGNGGAVGIDLANQLGESFRVNLSNAGDTVLLADGADTVIGGDGADMINTDGGNDSVDAGKGNDSILTGEGTDVVNAGDGNDTIDTGAGSDVVNAGKGNDVVEAGQGDTLDGGDDTDTLRFGSNFDDSSTDQVAGFENYDLTADGLTVNLASQTEDISIQGFASGASNITTGSGNDTLIGGTGADTLNGGAGNDAINAGEGADSLLGGSGDDSIVGADNDVKLDGGDGTDTVLITNNFNDGANDALLVDVEEVTLIASGKTLNLGGQSEGMTINGTGGVDTIVTGSGANLVNANYGDDVVTTGTGNNTVIGNDGNDTINVGGGQVSIDGGNGNDSIAMGTTLTANDTIAGGAGTDNLSFTDSNSATNDLNNVTGIDNILLGGDTLAASKFALLPRATVSCSI